MLYHVPDIDRALSEVRRVLRSGGTFYATTIGENGIGPYLHRELSRIDPRCNAFDEIISFSCRTAPIFCEGI
jgi:ubiquinone/menaquinone biosynthesis C-methylase UbiE